MDERCVRCGGPVHVLPAAPTRWLCSGCVTADGALGIRHYIGARKLALQLVRGAMR